MRGCEGARASIGFHEFSAVTATRLVLQLAMLTRDVSEAEDLVVAVAYLPAPATTSLSVP